MRYASVFLVFVSYLNYANSISYGKPVSKDRKYGFMVGVIEININNSNSPQLHCMGTFIRNNFILTAGHCLKYIGKNDLIYFVQYGVDEIDLDQDNFGAPVRESNVHFHPQYNKEEVCTDYDLALIKLPAADNFAEKQIDLCQETMYNGSTSIFISFINHTTSSPPFKLNYGEVSMANMDNCFPKSEQSEFSPKNNHICVHGKEREKSNFGDSGSPLIKPEENCLTGVLSCRYREYISFVNVSCFNDWINEVAQAYEEFDSKMEITTYLPDNTFAQNKTTDYSTPIDLGTTTDYSFNQKTEITTRISTEPNIIKNDIERTLCITVVTCGAILFIVAVIISIAIYFYLRKKRNERNSQFTAQYTPCQENVE